jgi:hypothetical protein
MILLVVVVSASSGLCAMVFVWRAVSCARFNRALRAFESVDEPARGKFMVAPESRSAVVDAQDRFEARAQEALAATKPRSA